MRNIDRCLDWHGRLRGKQRRSFEGFRNHPSERVRSYVERLEARWAEERRQQRELRRQEEGLVEASENEMTATTEAAEDEKLEPRKLSGNGPEDDDIPF